MTNRSKPTRVLRREVPWAALDGDLRGDGEGRKAELS
jgi:hypothetical protein